MNVGPVYGRKKSPSVYQFQKKTMPVKTSIRLMGKIEKNVRAMPTYDFRGMERRRGKIPDLNRTTIEFLNVLLLRGEWRVKNKKKERKMQPPSYLTFLHGRLLFRSPKIVGTFHLIVTVQFSLFHALIVLNFNFIYKK